MSSPLPPDETVRFNPPPNWPAPPAGWSPPRGWAPNPSWPAPPPDWRYWVTDRAVAAPVPAPPAKARPAALPAVEPPPVELPPAAAQPPATPPVATVTRATRRRPERGSRLRLSAAVIVAFLVGIGCIVYFNQPPGQPTENAPVHGTGAQSCPGACEPGQAAAGGSSVPVTSNGSVTATGPFGKAPQVTIPARPAARTLYVKTLIQGDGTELTSSDGLIGDYVAYDWSGETHKLLGSSYSSGKPSLFVGKLLPGLQKALTGQRAGSRVLAVIPPADGFGSSGNSKEGVGAGDTLVFIVDMASTFATAGVPGTQSSTGGGPLPTVTPPAPGAAAGPAITIPSGAAPPPALRVKTLIQGSGAVVAKGDNIAVQYTGVIWRTGKVFQSSWARQAPLTTTIGEGQVIAGWDAGLVGQPVGSRVLLVIPPADAYGSAGSATVGIKGDDTLVFVVDILAAA